MFIANSGTNKEVSILGNTFQGFVANAVDASNSAGTMCLELNNNTATPYANAYLIAQTGGTLNLVTPTGNSGQLQTTGTVTSVSSCP